MDASNVSQAASVEVRKITEAPAYDEPYRFGRKPTVRAPFPFTEHQFARLLIVRGRIRAEQSTDNRAEA